MSIVNIHNILIDAHRYMLIQEMHLCNFSIRIFYTDVQFRCFRGNSSYRNSSIWDLTLRQSSAMRFCRGRTDLLLPTFSIITWILSYSLSIVYIWNSRKIGHLLWRGAYNCYYLLYCYYLQKLFRKYNWYTCFLYSKQLLYKNVWKVTVIAHVHCQGNDPLYSS
jgi:hypothetical protein